MAGGGHAVQLGLLPFGHLRRDPIVIEDLAGGLECARDLRKLRSLPRRRNLYEWLSITLAPVQALFRDGIEEGKETVEITLFDGIVLVIVTARAAQSHAQPGRAGGLHAIDHVLHLILLRDRAALEVDH